MAKELEGRIIALYLLVVNCISLIVGPLLGGLFSDRVFAGYSLGGSLRLMASADSPVAGICLAPCLRPFREAVNTAREWEAE